MIWDTIFFIILPYIALTLAIVVANLSVDLPAIYCVQFVIPVVRAQ